jgi:hypothetical protein
MCGSRCRGGQLKLLGLHVVDGGVEASLISFEGGEVVGEGVGGGGETCPPLVLLGQHGLGCPGLVTRHGAQLWGGGGLGFGTSGGGAAGG